jgi:uncharacterized protein (TIGR03089 family)
VNNPETISAALDAAIGSDPARPLFTFYDDATGERTELSGATLMNWVAKTANMIVDDGGLGYGDRASVGLPPHWQSAAVQLGCWVAGLEVTTGPAHADIAFVDAANVGEEWDAPDRYVLGLHPMGLPMREVPDGYLDFTAEVRSHGDHFAPSRRVQPSDPALPGLTHAEACALATDRGSAWGLAGGRVLINADRHPDPIDWLLTPLVSGSTLVVCRHLDESKVSGRAAAERTTAQLL